MKLLPIFQKNWTFQQKTGDFCQIHNSLSLSKIPFLSFLAFICFNSDSHIKKIPTEHKSFCIQLGSKLRCNFAINREIHTYVTCTSADEIRNRFSRKDSHYAHKTRQKQSQWNNENNFAKQREKYRLIAHIQ